MSKKNKKTNSKDEHEIKNIDIEEKEEFFEEKKEKSTFQKVMNIILWVVLFVWMGMCLFDFYNVRKENEPRFCINKKTTKYSDGKVYSCLGLGYKVYNYKRDSYKGLEFGPFWSSDRSNKK